MSVTSTLPSQKKNQLIH